LASSGNEGVGKALRSNSGDPMHCVEQSNYVHLLTYPTTMTS